MTMGFHLGLETTRSCVWKGLGDYLALCLIMYGLELAWPVRWWYGLRDHSALFIIDDDPHLDLETTRSSARYGLENYLALCLIMHDLELAEPVRWWYRFGNYSTLWLGEYSAGLVWRVIDQLLWLRLRMMTMMFICFPRVRCDSAKCMANDLHLLKINLKYHVLKISANLLPSM